MSLSNIFPSKTIAIYMAKMFLVRTFAILFAVALVLQTLDVLSESGAVLAAPGNGQAQVWRYVSLRAPQIISFLLPFSVLLGTILTFFTMNQNSEVIALKAAGMSAHQVLAPLLIASAGVAAFSFVFNDRIVPRASATLSAWQKVQYGPLPIDSGDRSNVWVRDGDDLISVDLIQGRGTGIQLGGVTLYDRAGGSLQAIVRAPRGVRAGDGWKIGPVTRFEVKSGKLTNYPSLIIGRGVTPEQLTLASVSADNLSFGALSSAITDLREAGRQVTGGFALAQAVRADVGDADAAAGRGRGVRYRAVGQAVRARRHRHGAGLCLFRGGQFLDGDGRPGGLRAVSGRLGADLALLPDRRSGVVPDGRMRA